MTIQFDNGMAIGRTLLTDGRVQLYAAKLEKGFIWNVTRDYTKIFESRMFAKALDVYRGLAKEVSVS